MPPSSSSAGRLRARCDRRRAVGLLRAANRPSSDRPSSVTSAHRVATDGWASPRSTCEQTRRDADLPREAADRGRPPSRAARMRAPRSGGGPSGVDRRPRARADATPWWAAHSLPRVKRFVDPLTDFLHEEAAGGVALAVATVVALVWANSPADQAYADVWHFEVGFEVAGLDLHNDLGHWVNDGLMALFFFVVGLEIKRELVIGELRQRSAAVLPWRRRSAAC